MLLDPLSTADPLQRASNPGLLLQTATSRAASANGDVSGHTRQKASTEFEAVVLQNFIKAMMPKDAEAVFGGGISGDIWKSFLAEKIAMELARSGGLGLAKHISADRLSPALSPGGK